MKLTNYGKWTALYKKDHWGFGGPSEWRAGHINDPDNFDGGDFYVNGDFVSKWGNTPRVTIPEFKISETPVIRIGEIRQRRFNVIDRATQRTRQEIQAQEDINIFDALDKI